MHVSCREALSSYLNAYFDGELPQEAVDVVVGEQHDSCIPALTLLLHGMIGLLSKKGAELPLLVLENGELGAFLWA